MNNVSHSSDSLRKLSLKFIIFVSILIIFSLLLNLSQKRVFSFGSDKIKWLNFQKAMKKNINIKKPFLIWVHETGCEYCELFKKNVLSKTIIIYKINKYFYPIKSNGYGNKKYLFFNGKMFNGKSLSAKFNVIGFPTTVFLNSDYKKIFTLPGYWDKKNFILVLDWIGSGLYKKESLRRYFKSFSK